MDLEDKLAERDAEWADALAVVLGDLKFYRLNPLAWAETASVKLKVLRDERDALAAKLERATVLAAARTAEAEVVLAENRALTGQVAEWQKKFAEVVAAKQTVVADLEAAEATLTLVNGLLDPQSLGRPPQCKLCDVCAAMLKAALHAPPLAARMAADPEFVRRTEEGWKALDEGRCTPLDEVKKKLGG